MVYVIQVCWQLVSRIRMDPARKLSANLYDIYHCCVYSEKIPDDGQRNCLKHVEFYSQNKFEKWVHLVGFIITIFLTWCVYIFATCKRKGGGDMSNIALCDIKTHTVFWNINIPSQQIRYSEAPYRNLTQTPPYHNLALMLPNPKYAPVSSYIKLGKPSERMLIVITIRYH